MVICSSHKWRTDGDSAIKDWDLSMQFQISVANAGIFNSKINGLETVQKYDVPSAN